MHAYLFYWNQNFESTTGYQNGERIDEDLFKVAEKIFNAGLNVMIIRGTYSITLWVNDKRFIQS
jgi:hypothetical protein